MQNCVVIEYGNSITYKGIQLVLRLTDCSELVRCPAAGQQPAAPVDRLPFVYSFARIE